MPELPEVETVRATLLNVVKDLEIVSVEIKYTKIIRGINVTDFCNNLVGQTINNINRIGKYLIFELDDYALVSHLRMEGKYYYREESFITAHDHICFVLSNGMCLVYNDTRKFGTMNLEPIDTYSTANYIAKLGLEPLDDNLSVSYLKEKISKKNVAIKTALLDQTNISGLGNIYVDEVLFLSSILPDRKCCDITDEEYLEIVNSCKIVINKAISEGGTTIKSFSASEGVHGRFQNHLNVHTKKTCGVCGGVVTKIKVNGRGTYFCINCQR